MKRQCMKFKNYNCIRGQVTILEYGGSDDGVLATILCRACRKEKPDLILARISTGGHQQDKPRWSCGADYEICIRSCKQY